MTQSRIFSIFAIAGALAAGGCSGNGLPVGGDGGVDCTTLDEVSCRSDSRCAAYSPCCCGGAIRCVAASSSPPVCNIACTNGPCTDPCKGQDEATCKSSQACIADYCSECSCTPTYVGCRLPSSQPAACPALGCAQPSCTCDSLGETACVAAESTMGCTPFYCPGCNGGQTFQGCLGPNEGTGACPQVCSNACRQQTDCMGGQECLAPGQPLCGGACLIPPACNGDAFCQANGGGANMICDYPQCNCGGMMGCIPGCTQASDCPGGDTCSPTHHCVPLPCGQCPAHFVCSQSGTGCERQTCNVDGDCGGGFCVEGSCYDSLGMCSFLPG